MLRYRLCLLVLCLIAAGLRLYRLDAAVLSRDEGSSWRVSRYEPLDVVRHCAANVHAPLSFLLLKAWTGVFGDSVFAMRSLSALYGVLCVPLMYLVVVESAHLRWPASPSPLAGKGGVRATASGSSFSLHPSSLHCGALFAAALVTFHPLQLEASRTARMYSLGALLTLISTWLLLRALRHPERAWPFWIAYSLAAAALAYTHIYGLFTIAAQFLFAFLYSVASTRSTGSLPVSTRSAFGQCATSLRGLFLAAGLFLIIYSPWMSVLKSQAQEVGTGNWIPESTLASALADVGEWALGRRSEFSTVVAFCVIAVALTEARRPAPLLLLGILIAPWVAAYMFHVISGQNVVQLRYLAMSQVALFAVFMFASMHAHRYVCVVPTFFVVLVIAAGSETLLNSSTLSSLEQVAAYLAREHTACDVVVVRDLGELTRSQYYLVHAGLDDSFTYAEYQPSFTTGHEPHLGSLKAQHLAFSWEDFKSARSVWLISRRTASAVPPAGWKLTQSQNFPGFQVGKCQRRNSGQTSGRKIR